MADGSPAPQSPSAHSAPPDARSGVPAFAAATIAVVALLLGGVIGWAIRGEGDDRASRASEESSTTSPTAVETTTTSTTTTQPGPVEVLRVSGSVDDETQDFTVSGSWQVTATVDGVGIDLLLFTPAGDFVDGGVMGPGTNTSRFRQGGTYYMSISANLSTYEVVVTDTPG